MASKSFDFRSVIFLVSIYTAFVASGASSLFAEVTWNRMLIVIVGNSMTATALIIVVFMGGLGLGSYTGGKLIGTRRPSLVPYLLLETAIGSYILLSPSIFDLLSHAFSALAESVHDRASLTFVRIIVSLAALFLPAFLMGATFPAMIYGASPDSSFKRAARTGFLYSINTLGAAVGCFVAGYYLLFEFGVQITLVCAFGLNIVAALCAFVANTAKKSMPSEDLVKPLSYGKGPIVDTEFRRFLNIATFLMGFVALAYEVLLTRLGILYVGNIASVFALVLTGFLLGTGISAVLGTWIYGVLRRNTKYSDKFFGFVTLAAGALVLGTPFFLLEFGQGLTAAEIAQQLGDSHFAILNLGIIIVPTILIGSLLPIAIRMLEPEDRGEATKEAATLYALNTAGGLIGAGLVNHLLVPVIGLKGVLIFLTCICVAVGIFNLFSARRSFLRWTISILGVGLLSVVLIASVPNMMDLYAKKIAKDLGAPLVKVQVKLVHEGRAANVAVFEASDPRQIFTYRDMFLNGIEEASTRYYHEQVFKLLGELPVLVHESDKPLDALVIAFGAGMTAGSVLASDQVASLDVVDLNPDIKGINNCFTDANGDVFHQSRFHFYNDDGRNYLVTSAKRYDVIISDSTHPRAYDSWILYTKEFYESVKKRLRYDGIFAQWVPVDHSMEGQLFRIHLNTFRSVFPTATLWYVYGSDQAFLLATPRHLTLNVQRIQQKLDRLPEWFQARYYQIDTIAHLSGFFWLDEAMMTKMIGSETRVNSDNLHFFDKKSTLLRMPGKGQLQLYQASILPSLEQTDDGLRAAINKEQNTAQFVARYRFLSNPFALIAAYCLEPNNGDVLFWMSIESSKNEMPDIADICRTFSY
jgi:spermidine synthase